MIRKSVIKAWEAVLSRDPLDVPWDLIDDTLALLKEDKPQLLSYEEVNSPEPEIGLWLEDRGHKGDVMLVLYNGGVDEDMEFTDATGEKHYRDSYDYNVLWRCWTAKPTYEQRKAVKWE